MDLLVQAYALVDDLRARRTSVVAAADAGLRLLRVACEHPRVAQEQLLRRLVDEARETELGRAHGFADIATAPDAIAAFRARVPVRTYDDLQPAIERAAAGDRDVLRPGLPGFLAQTSGTTGAPKLVPFAPAAEMAYEFLPFLLPAFGAVETAYPGAIEGRQMILSRFVEGASTAGIPIGAASGFVRELLRTEAGVDRVPGAVFDEAQLGVRYYAMFLYMLSQPLVWLAALNPSTLLTFLDQLDAFAPQLAGDLADGTWQRGPDGIDATMRAAARPVVRSPDRAARLAASLATHGRVMLEDVCPELRVVSTWRGGNAKHYLGQLRARLPACTIRSEVSGSSEGALLIPLDDDTEGGVPPLLSTFVELTPADGTPDDVHELEDLRADTGYRFIITNRRSMVRFLMDDVFYLERFEGKTPVLRFSHRHGLTSSITGEKLTEIQIVDAVDTARASSGLDVLDFQARPEWGEPPSYALLVEVDGTPADQAARFLAAFEAALQQLNVEYAAKRSSRRLGAASLVLLPRGELRRWQKAELAASGRSDAQAKIARLRRELLTLPAAYPRVR